MQTDDQPERISEATMSLEWLRNAPPRQRMALFRLYQRAIELAQEAEELEQRINEAARLGSDGAANVKEVTARADITVQASSPL